MTFDRQDIKRLAKEFHGLLKRVVRSGTNEATFKEEIDHFIKEFTERAGIKVKVSSEYTLAAGRADTVFNNVVIEYKRPGILKEIGDRKTEGAIEQVKAYLEELEKRERYKNERLAGIVFDGNKVIFVRKVRGNWKVEGPEEADEKRLERMLIWLLGVRPGKALTPEHLSEDFQAEEPRAQRVLRAFYRGLERSMAEGEEMVGKLYEQWKLFFSEAIDYSEAFGGKKLAKLKEWTRKAGIEIDTSEEAERFFFALHTYFALLVKLLGWFALTKHFGVKLGGPTFGEYATARSEELKRKLKELERGGIFKEYGITNLLEGDFFSWYLHAWDEEMAKAVREIISKLDEYDPTTLSLIPEETRDLFKKLYHYLLPRSIRHNLGEYYTPDWLAQWLLKETVKDLFEEEDEAELLEKTLKVRILDPACGSGTFLVLTIGRIKEIGQKLMIDGEKLLEAILSNVVGFDLNPLAVLTARVNYMLAIADLLEYRRGEITIPVYLADSVRTPAEGEELFSRDTYEFTTTVGKFQVPAVLCKKGRFESFMVILEKSLEDELSEEEVVEEVKEIVRKDEWSGRVEKLVREIYGKMLELHRRGLNGVWARLLSNNFAPLVVGEFDYVVGNPPWINWEHLPDGYRRSTVKLWKDMNVGGNVKLGKKWDISYLMTQVVAHYLLKRGGKLGFVITQAAFKTRLGAQGFRRFQLPDGTPLKVLRVDDMVDLKPFEGASNRTAVMILEKGKPTEYPVPYIVWKKKKGSKFTYDSKLEEVLKATERLEFVAEPVDSEDITSPWLTARPKTLSAIRKVLGESDYKAHEGINTGGANGVYWVEILKEREDGLVAVRNITEGTKRKVKEVTAAIEPDLLYPLLRGRDVKRWRAEPSAYIIMTYRERKDGHLEIIPPQEMLTSYRKTYDYFKRFEEILKLRTDYKHYIGPAGKPFYAVVPRPGVFSPWKVVWPNIASDLNAAVVGEHNGKIVVPQHIVTLIACASSTEAHYICALINSSVANFTAKAYSQTGGKSFGTPHILENIRIPRFDSKNPLHVKLSELSQKAHEAAKRGREEELKRIEEEIDELAAELWGLSEEELKDIQQSLKELSE